jgi:hypothetical protein
VQGDLDPGERIKHGVQLMVYLSRWWVQHSRYTTALRWLLPLADLSAPRYSRLPLALRAEALLWLSEFGYRVSDAALTQSAAQKSWDLAVQAGDAVTQARAVGTLGMGHWLAGDNATARVCCLRSVAMFRALQAEQSGEQAQGANPGPVQTGLIKALNQIAEICRVDGAFAESQAYNEEVLAYTQASGQRHGIAVCLENLGLLAIAQGQYDLGCVQLQQACGHFQSVGDGHGQTYVIQGIGLALQRQGDAARAAYLYGGYEAYSDETGFTLWGPDKTAHELSLATLRQDTPPKIFDPAFQAGKHLSAAQVLQAVMAMAFGPQVRR